jgi:mRNA-degrading endonuclease RelE of RelBE toxin-antitoxin system
MAASTARRFMHDQHGMRAVIAAINALADDSYPAEGFHRSRYHRLRTGDYRVLYVIDDDLITIERVDRVINGQG